MKIHRAPELSGEIFEKINKYEESINNIDCARDNLDQFIIALNENNITSDDATKYLNQLRVKKTINIIIGVLLIITGLGLLFFPITDELKIATIFYFNAEDGITISDLVALIIILTGIYKLSSSVHKNK